MEIIVGNLYEHEELPHALVLLEGVVHGFHAHARPREQWFLRAGLASDPRNALFWPVTESGRFKALVQLPHASSAYEQPTRHGIALHVMGTEYSRMFHVVYRPVKTRYQVRFYYQRCADAPRNEGFDGPVGTDTSDEAAKDRIRLGALLMQTAMSEMLRHAGLPRQTFALECSDEESPVVHSLHTTFSTADARRMHDQKLIKLIEKDIIAQGMDASPDDRQPPIRFKHAVILGCSKYNPVTKKAEGHTALGGGKVGIFGSCGLHTWPRALHALTASCLNNALIDTSLLMDDSCHRGTFWGNFATGIGAFLHELGHTLGLGHATSGIMARGFDDMNRLWSVYEPVAHPRPSRGSPPPPAVLVLPPLPPAPASHLERMNQQHVVRPDGYVQLNHAMVQAVLEPRGAHWHIGSARQLVHDPWIAGRAKSSSVGPTLSWTRNVRGPVGLGQYDGAQTRFNHRTGADIETNTDIAAVCIEASAFLDSVTTLTSHELAHISAQQQLRSAGCVHWVVFAPNEYITHVEVRAMAWIDGLRIHTNLRATRWYGGFGGRLHVLRAASGLRIHGFFGTRGEKHVGQLGVYCSGIPDATASRMNNAERSKGTAIRNAQRLPPIGRVRGSARAKEFSFGNLLSGSAIVVTCDSARVLNLRVIPPEQYASTTRRSDGPAAFTATDHIWQILPGENITSLAVQCGRGIDGIRFLTNLRQSPWIGAYDPVNVQELVAPLPTRVCGLYGTLGHSSGIESIGIYVGEAWDDDQGSSAFTAGSASIISETIASVGTGEHDGTQVAWHSDPDHAFSYTRDTADIGAIRISAGKFLNNVWTYPRGSAIAMQAERDQSTDKWFVLMEGEYVTQVDVRAMCWIDGIGFHTSEGRQSPWYGGQGGEMHHLRPSQSGYKIHGFHGSHGNRYVGSLGALGSPIAEVVVDHASSSAPPGIQNASRHNKHFSLHGIEPLTLEMSDPIPARGVLIAVQNGTVQFVSSFVSLHEKQRYVEDIQGFLQAASGGGQLFSFTFSPGEHLIQVDVALRDDQCVGGICLHTTTRCSSWFGMYQDGMLRFVVAPPGSILRSLRGTAGVVGVEDLVGEICVIDDLEPSPPFVEDTGYAHNHIVLEDPGTFDIRVEAQSADHGIETIFLLKKRNHEHLDRHAWTWPGISSTTCHPSVWCLAPRMLEHHIRKDTGNNALSTEELKSLLMDGYAVGAIDTGGGFSKAASPPAL